MDVRGLGYVGLEVEDVAGWVEFATAVIGLAPARPPGSDQFDTTFAPSDGTVHLKADAHRWSVAVLPGARPRLAFAGFEFASSYALNEAREHLSKEGFAYTESTAAERAARAVQDLIHLEDPNGVRIELYWGPEVDGRLVSPVGVPRFVTEDLGLGHYMVFSPAIDAAMDFYQRGLGFRLTDFTEIGPGQSAQFLRCGPRHHTVAMFGGMDRSALHHIALEVPSIDDVGYALERAVRAGLPITASLGRHKNDRMLSFYMLSPGGFEVEIGCDARLIDESTWVANRVNAEDAWGHHGLTTTAMIDTVNRQEARS